MSDDSESDPRLTVVCTDGTTIGCTNFKAIDSGVLLFEDLKKNRAFGFVSNDEVRFVVPTDTAERIAREAADDGFEDPLMELPGVGRTYAKRLRSAGYASVDDLAGADPETLADQTGANVTRTTEWVDHAKGTGSETTDTDE